MPQPSNFADAFLGQLFDAKLQASNGGLLETVIAQCGPFGEVLGVLREALTSDGKAQVYALMCLRAWRRAATSPRNASSGAPSQRARIASSTRCACAAGSCRQCMTMSAVRRAGSTDAARASAEPSQACFMTESTVPASLGDVALHAPQRRASAGASTNTRRSNERLLGDRQQQDALADHDRLRGDPLALRGARMRREVVDRSLDARRRARGRGGGAPAGRSPGCLGGRS